MLPQMFAVGLASRLLSGCGDDSAEMKCPDSNSAFIEH